MISEGLNGLVSDLFGMVDENLFVDKLSWWMFVLMWIVVWRLCLIDL